jgi:hypothetical protein
VTVHATAGIQLYTGTDLVTGEDVSKAIQVVSLVPVGNVVATAVRAVHTGGVVVETVKDRMTGPLTRAEVLEGLKRIVEPVGVVDVVRFRQKLAWMIKAIEEGNDDVLRSVANQLQYDVRVLREMFMLHDGTHLESLVHTHTLERAMLCSVFQHDAAVLAVCEEGGLHAAKDVLRERSGATESDVHILHSSSVLSFDIALLAKAPFGLSRTFQLFGYQKELLDIYELQLPADTRESLCRTAVDKISASDALKRNVTEKTLSLPWTQKGFSNYSGIVSVERAVLISSGLVLSNKEVDVTLEVSKTHDPITGRLRLSEVVLPSSWRLGDHILRLTCVTGVFETDFARHATPASYTQHTVSMPIDQLKYIEDVYDVEKATLTATGWLLASSEVDVSMEARKCLQGSKLDLRKFVGPSTWRMGAHVLHVAYRKEVVEVAQNVSTSELFAAIAAPSVPIVGNSVAETALIINNNNNDDDDEASL